MGSKDFISLMDFSKHELEHFFHQAFEIKHMLKRGQDHPFLLNKVVGMLFSKPSTRTRVSFETGITQMGGHAQFYTTDVLQTANKESWTDTGKVLNRYIDGLVIRLYNLGTYDEARNALRTLGESGSMPIINALDDKEHPCQIMADIMTMIERFGFDAYKEKKVVMSWAYSARNRPAGVPQAMIAAASILGMNLTVAYPEGYELDPDYVKFAEETSKVSGASITYTNDPFEAAKGADVIEIKNWGSRTMSEEEDLAGRSKLKNDWCFSERHFKEAKKEALFMHCLPVERNQEATDELIDGPRSIIYDEAENRLHVQKAILSLLVK